MKIKIGFFPPKTAYEGWEASVSLTGEPGTWKPVPAKIHTDFHGSSQYVAYDSKEEVIKAAKRHAKSLLGI